LKIPLPPFCERGSSFGDICSSKNKHLGKDIFRISVLIECLPLQEKGEHKGDFQCHKKVVTIKTGYCFCVCNASIYGKIVSGWKRPYGF